MALHICEECIKVVLKLLFQIIFAFIKFPLRRDLMSHYLAADFCLLSEMCYLVVSSLLFGAAN